MIRSAKHLSEHHRRELFVWLAGDEALQYIESADASMLRAEVEQRMAKLRTS